VTWIGYALLVIAAIWILYKLYISFNSAGGTAYQVPVYDAAVYPPIMVAVGLFCVLRGNEVHWPVWSYVALWLALTGVTAGAIKVLEELGDRPLQ
jgi:hypothetical protein